MYSSTIRIHVPRYNWERMLVAQLATIASDELPCPAGTYSSFTASNSSADRASCFDAPQVILKELTQ